MNNEIQNNNVTEDTSIIPATPSDYVLPKDQQMMTQKLATVNSDTQNIPAPPVAPTSDIPAPPSAPSTDDTNVAGTINTTNVAPPTMDLSNVDLNANANAQSLDLTMQSGAKEGITITGKTKPKKKIKIVPLVLIILFIGGLIGGGVYFYISQFKSYDKRIDAVVDGFFAPLNNTTNYKINDGSGNYTFSYNSSSNENEIILETKGKYAYSLPSKQIDLISNFTKYSINQDLLPSELNTELYLKDNQAYLLLSNFNENYIYTDIDNSYNTIKDLESKFNNPEELLLFKLTNTLYEGGLDSFSKDYNTYITNISKNDNIDYKAIINGVKSAIKSAIKAAPITQSIEGSNNVVTIDVRSANTQKKMYKAFIDNLYNNKKAFEALSTIVGVDQDKLYNQLSKKVEEKEYKDLTKNLVIKTNMFKSSLIGIYIPYNDKDGEKLVSLTPYKNGYSINISNNSKNILEVKYTKSTSKTSTTETKGYKVEGKTYKEDTVTNLNINLEVVKDVTPSKDYPITKDSIAYSVLTEEHFNAISSKIESFGNLGVLFKSHYKGSTTQEGAPTNEMP